MRDDAHREPIERVSEVFFGLIMVLNLHRLSAAEVGRADVRAMLVAALGRNLAWGIIDGAMYWMGCLADEGGKLHTPRSPRGA